MRAGFITVTLVMLASIPAWAQDPAPDAARAEARAHLANQQWGEAKTLLEPITRGPQANARDWYGLGLAHHGLGRYDAAIAAFDQAERQQFPAVGPLYLQRARSLLASGQKEQALAALETMAQAGGVNFRRVQQMPEFSELAGDARFTDVINALRPCQGPEFRQFDFWLGQWDVTPVANPAQTYTNQISRAEDGCLIMEDYAAGAFTGTSMNFYDSNTGKWHQAWMSNAGGAVHLMGGLNDQGAMVMSDEGLPVSAATGMISRVTWTPNPDGSVRQLWEQSQDRGESWTIVFDGLYRRSSVE